MKITTLSNIIKYCEFFRDNDALASLKLDYLKNKQDLEKISCLLAGVEHDDSKTWGEDGYFNGHKVEVKNTCFVGKTKMTGRVKFHDLSLNRIDEFENEIYWLFFGCYSINSEDSNLCDVIFGFTFDSIICNILRQKISNGKTDPEISLTDFEHKWKRGEVHCFYKRSDLHEPSYSRKFLNYLKTLPNTTPSNFLNLDSSILVDDNLTQFRRFLESVEFFEDDFFQIFISNQFSNQNINPNTIIKSYKVYGKNHLSSIEDQIKLECETYNAQAYFSPLKKNLKTMAFKTLGVIKTHIENGNFDIEPSFKECLLSEGLVDNLVIKLENPKRESPLTVYNTFKDSWKVDIKPTPELFSFSNNQDSYIIFNIPKPLDSGPTWKNFLVRSGDFIPLFVE